MARIYVSLLVLLGIACLASAHSYDKPCDKGFAHNGTATGVEAKIAGFNVYVSLPSANSSTKSIRRYPTVILIHDIYGYKQNSTRFWSDRLAKSGFISVLPDLFKGDPWSQDRNQSDFAAWGAKFPRDQVLAGVASIQKELILKGVNSYRVGLFGAQGFCWGGQFSDLLATGSHPAVTASVVYHGSRITPEDIQAINAPVYFIGADPDLDNNFNNTLHQYAVNVVDSKRNQHIDARIRSYEGLSHGFTLRGDPTNATIKAGADDAFERGAKFLWRHLAW